MALFKSIARREVDDITSNLRQVQIQGEIVEGDQVGLVGQQVEVVIAAEAIQGIVGEITTPTFASTSLRILQSANTSTSIPPSVYTLFILFPLATSRLGIQHWRELGTKVLGP